MSVLIVADPHLPFCHPRYLDFCVWVKKKWRCSEVVFIGDIIDLHALSFHEHDPNGMSPEQECVEAEKCLQIWHKAFPKARVCIGNHDARAIRMARRAGIPMRFIKDFNVVWNTPGWKWEWEHEVDGVRYVHGTGNSGKTAALNLAINRRQSIVMGHTHTFPVFSII